MNKPIVCQGWCFTELRVMEENELPVVFITFCDEGWDKAQTLGWTIVNDVRFNGRVMLCPKCSKRWKQERADNIDRLIKRIPKVTTYFELDYLRNEFHKLHPTDEELERFHSTQPEKWPLK
jgi:hypothetical protein